jgi:hypothetical protein
MAEKNTYIAKLYNGGKIDLFSFCVDRQSGSPCPYRERTPHSLLLFYTPQKIIK